MNVEDTNLVDIQSSEDALDQSIALNRITLSLLKAQKDSNRRMFILLIISLVINLVMFFGMLYYESQWETVEEEVITTTQEVNGDDARINNVQGDQYNDNSVHNEGVDG